MGRTRGVFVTQKDDPVFGRKAWSARYDSSDQIAGRPIHPGMTVAPPWAEKLTRRNRRP